MTLFSPPLCCLRDRLGEYQPGAWISRTDTPQQFNLCPLSLGPCAVCPCTVNETDRQNISLLLGSLGQTPGYSLTCVLCFCDLTRTVCPCPVYQTDRQDVSLVPGSSNSLIMSFYCLCDPVQLFLVLSTRPNGRVCPSDPSNSLTCVLCLYDPTLYSLPLSRLRDRPADISLELGPSNSLTYVF